MQVRSTGRTLYRLAHNYPTRCSTSSTISFRVHYLQRRHLSSAYMGDNIINFYAGQPPLNRLSFQRSKVAQIEQHLRAPDARFIVFKDFQPLVKKGSIGQIMFFSSDDVKDLIADGFLTPPEDVLSDKDRSRFYETARLPHDAPALVFLGVNDRSNGSPINLLSPEGTPYFAVDIGDTQWSNANGEWGDARASANEMDGWTAGIFAQARALIDWNVRNKFCAACGSRTYSLWAGWKRSCTSALEAPSPDKRPCFSTQGLHNFSYPRTDPVIIMGILNSAGDKMLLGRQSRWPKGMYSCLAGFIEPGESFEDAVRREVLEEAGIEVGPVRYSSSQPWPYPANLMVGCFGRAKDGQTIRLDLDNELEDAQWFSRADVAKLVGTPAASQYSRAELKKFDQDQQKPPPSERDSTTDALAPSERKSGEGETQGTGLGLSRVPADTAIAGQLIRLWAAGSLELVSRL